MYRNELVVTTVEKEFDVILEVCIKLNHACSNSKNEDCIKEQLGYYGVPKTAVQCFTDTCAVLSSMALHCGTESLLLYFLTQLYIYVPVYCKHSTDKDSTTATEHDSAKKSR